MIRFIRRNTRGFKNLLYSTAIRPRIEYYSVVWSLIYNVHTKRLKIIQRRVVKHISSKVNISSELNTQKRLLYLGLSLLNLRWTHNEFLFLYKLLNGLFTNLKY